MQIANLVFGMAVLLASGSSGWAQEGGAALEKGDSSVSGDLTDRVGEIGARLNQSETVREVSAGLLDPIYRLAEYMNLPWFHWAAFAVMAAGVVSFALQLVLTKLFLLMQLKLSIQEVISDLLGLVISLVGLVLTTQAAAENSTFTASPASVVSAAAAGIVVGFVFYLWGQKTELRAARPDMKPDVGGQRRSM